MSLFDVGDPSVRMYDYDAPSHSIYEDARIAKALAELEKISRLEAAQRALVEELTRAFRLPRRRPIDSNVISLKGRGNAHNPDGGHS